MRVFISHLVTETNTFAPYPTGRRGFEEMGIHHGDVTRTDQGGVFTILALWRSLAEAGGHQVVEGLAAQAQPGGRTLKALYEAFRDEILEQVRAALPVQVILFNLHGAMSAIGYDDCEGDLLGRVRALVGPAVAIGAEIDLHCHLTPQMLAAADIIVAYKQYPHTDIAERAREVFALTLATAEKRIAPVTSAVDCRMVGLWHTTREPMAGFVRRMEALEAEESVLSVSFGHGFPWGDVQDGGARLWVITDADRALGDRLALELAEELFAMREQSGQKLLSIDAALDAAQAAVAWPVVAADGADNPGGGAPSDSTFVLQRMIERATPDALIAFLYDPEAVRIMADAGVGAQLDIRVGGKTGPSSGAPVDICLTVKAILPDHSQMGLGLNWPLGTTVWAQGPNRLDLILTSVRSQPFAPDCIAQLGVDLSAKRLIVVKSIQHFHAGFAPIARGGVVYLSAPGALTSDFAEDRLPGQEPCVLATRRGRPARPDARAVRSPMRTGAPMRQMAGAGPIRTSLPACSLPSPHRPRRAEA